MTTPVANPAEPTEEQKALMATTDAFRCFAYALAEKAAPRSDTVPVTPAQIEHERRKAIFRIYLEDAMHYINGLRQHHEYPGTVESYQPLFEALKTALKDFCIVCSNTSCDTPVMDAAGAKFFRKALDLVGAAKSQDLTWVKTQQSKYHDLELYVEFDQKPKLSKREVDMKVGMIFHEVERNTAKLFGDAKAEAARLLDSAKAGVAELIAEYTG